MVRWASERGEEILETEKDVFETYIKNLKTIYENLKKESKEANITIISSILLEDQLEQFYKGLHVYFNELSHKVIPGWIDRVGKNSACISDYIKYLE
jgi:L-rhamnose mutarotase